MPRHLAQAGERAHELHMVAFVGDEPRLYIGRIELSSDNSQVRKSIIRAYAEKPGMGIPDFSSSGTGMGYLLKNRPLLRLMKAKVKASVRAGEQPDKIANELAALNLEVSRACVDGTVGPNCIVAWMDRDGGGAHRCYDGTTYQNQNCNVPILLQGMDLNSSMQSAATAFFQAIVGGEDLAGAHGRMKQTFIASVEQLRNEPDEKLE